jgi:hypothetical protein
VAQKRVRMHSMSDACGRAPFGRRSLTQSMKPKDHTRARSVGRQLLFALMSQPMIGLSFGEILPKTDLLPHGQTAGRKVGERPSRRSMPRSKARKIVLLREGDE